MIIRLIISFFALVVMLLSRSCGWYENFGFYMVKIDDMQDSTPQELIEDERYEYARIDEVVYYPRIAYSKDTGGYSFCLIARSYSGGDVYVSEVVATFDGKEIYKGSDLTLSLEEFSGAPGIYGTTQELTVFYDDDLEFYDGMIISIVVYVGEDRIPINYVAEVYEPDSVPWPT